MGKKLFMIPRSHVSLKLWPRCGKYVGFASGWEAAAWVSIHQNKLDEGRNCFKLRAKILNNLGRKTWIEKKYCSQMLGKSARLSVLAHLVMLSKESEDKESLVLLKREVAIWSKEVLNYKTELDLMLGKAGALIAAAEVQTLLPSIMPRLVIKKLQQQVQRKLVSELDSLNHGKSVYVGFSHGLSGYLYALECVQHAFNIKLENDLRNKCIEVIATERYTADKKSAVWPVWSSGEPVGMHGWCHGAPGIALGFICGYQLTGNKKYKQLAELGLHATVKFPPTHYSFCCGAIGNAQILIEAYRITGNQYWFKAAQRLAKEIRMPEAKRAERGFHKGSLGKTYLDERLKNPNLPLLGLGPISIGGVH